MGDNKELPTQISYYFEDYEIGQTVTSVARTVTETDVVAFAALSGDWNPIHTDAVYAAKHVFGQRVAHGALVLSIATGLANRLGFLEQSVLAFRQIDGWKFSLPVFFGDTVRVRATVDELKLMRRLGGGLVTLKVEILNQNDEVVQRGRWTVLVKTREG